MGLAGVGPDSNRPDLLAERTVFPRWLLAVNLVVLVVGVRHQAVASAGAAFAFSLNSVVPPLSPAVLSELVFSASASVDSLLFSYASARLLQEHLGVLECLRDQGGAQQLRMWNSRSASATSIAIAIGPTATALSGMPCFGWRCGGRP
ncbi:hypothetical protein [Dactylosporangium sp. NPDC051541]|uniref:hypothetical protein n=1 Tax=Dactylosporangium sp. NPDC051541 TaxID=3363977 RepID=UPI0037AB354E